MVDQTEVNRQLKQLGVKFKFWCRPEIHELPKILFDGEMLQHVLIGHYEGGFALICATDKRVLLVDKKPFYLTIEDIRYDMISDVQYNHRLINATVRLGTVHKTISFTGYNHIKLRSFTSYIQELVMVYRQQLNAPVQQANTLNNILSKPITNPMESAINLPNRKVMNPYNMPVIIRRRVSRFY